MKKIDWGEMSLDDFKKDPVSVLEVTGAYWIARPETDEDWQRHYFLQVEFYDLRQAFEQGSACAAVVAYLAAADNGYDPPYWVQRWLYDAFFEFDASAGQKDLRALLNLTGKQRTGNEYARRLRLDRDETIFAGLLRLKTLTGLGVEKCAEIFSHQGAGFYSSGGGYSRHRQRLHFVALGVKALCGIFDNNKHLLSDPGSWACHWLEDAQADRAGVFAEYREAMRKAAADTNCSFTSEDFRRVEQRVLQGEPEAARP